MKVLVFDLNGRWALRYRTERVTVEEWEMLRNYISDLISQTYSLEPKKA